jgi:hypothetical protein
LEILKRKLNLFFLFEMSNFNKITKGEKNTKNRWSHYVRGLESGEPTQRSCLYLLLKFHKLLIFHSRRGFWKNKIIIWHPSAEPEKGTTIIWFVVEPSKVLWYVMRLQFVECNLAAELLLHLVNYMKQWSSMDEVGSPYMPRVASTCNKNLLQNILKYWSGVS